jgi:hypothetical protein
MDIVRTVQFSVVGVSTTVVSDEVLNPLQDADFHTVICEAYNGDPGPPVGPEPLTIGSTTIEAFFMPRPIGSRERSTGVSPIYRDGVGSDTFEEPILATAGSTVGLFLYFEPAIGDVTDFNNGEYRRVEFQVTLLVTINGRELELPVAGGPFALHYANSPTDTTMIGGRRLLWKGGRWYGVS